MASAVGRPVVLIVEDEALLRISGAEMVADAGYDVVEAGNADEAIAILEARADIHIVFTDIQFADAPAPPAEPSGQAQPSGQAF